MRNETYFIDGVLYTRVTKATARKAFNNQYGVYIVPCNARVDAYSGCFGCIINDRKGDTFDNLCNHFRYYNCNNDIGNYIKYFLFHEV